VLGQPWRPLVEDFLRDGSDPAHVDALLAWFEETDPTTRVAELLAPAPDLLSRLDQVAVPVLVVHGEQDDAVLLESSQYLAEHLPYVELAVFQRSGHAPFAEEPGAFADAVTRYLRDVR
jgi:pimeloyl-ACP methyl ester carboxylesterase